MAMITDFTIQRYVFAGRRRTGNYVFLTKQRSGKFEMENENTRSVYKHQASYNIIGFFFSCE